MSLLGTFIGSHTELACVEEKESFGENKQTDITGKSGNCKIKEGKKIYQRVMACYSLEKRERTLSGEELLYLMSKN